jgi:mRNA-degrading endonuclease YafQ of YafQ-DinJ toxin-antitoxin module
VWEVKLTSKAEKELEEHLKLGKVNQEDIKLLKLWVNQVETHGPKYIRNEPKWDDHALRGNLEGHRSSCYSGAGRIIYKIKEKKIIVEVIRITPDHNYKT